MDAEVRRAAESVRIVARAALRQNRILVQELTGLMKQLDRFLDAEPERKAERNGRVEERVNV
jgi:hypothetical protein